MGADWDDPPSGTFAANAVETFRKRLSVKTPTKLTQHLDALTEEAIRRSLEIIGETLFIRYGDVGHASVEERGWLIEWPPTPDTHPRWWHPEHGWSVDASRAIRYARKEDAEAAIKGSRFNQGVATEHAWMTPPPAESGPSDGASTRQDQ